MTRKEIEETYKIENGIIKNPGKFESEPIWTPYFYDLFSKGWTDDDIENNIVSFNLNKDDFKEFPELKGYKQVSLWFDDNGFVYGYLS